MKKGTLILLGMFMMFSTVEAKNGENIPDRFRVNYSYNDAVNFIERGIEFYIFTNGDFDFETRFNDNRLRVNRNFKGQIRSIGNVFIHYDFRGNVSRIGDVSIRYDRGRLTNVGDLRVRYDRWEYPTFYGNVRNFYYNNGVRFNVSFGDVCNYNDAYFFRNDFRRNYSQFREDRNFFYYRANANARIGKRSTILKRRKPASIHNSRRKTVNADSRNSYRNSKRKTADRNVKRTKRSSNVATRNNTKRKSAVNTDRRTNNRNTEVKRTTRSVNSSNRKSSNRNKVVKPVKRTTNRNTKVHKSSRAKSEVKKERKRSTRNTSN